MKPGSLSAASAARLGPLLVLLCVVAAYSNSFSGAFLLDDHRRIVHNPDIRAFATAVSRTDRPVVNATFWLNHAVDGVRPAGYHLLNVALHACSALLLCGLTRRILQSGRFGAAAAGAAVPLGLCVAALWGVHPLATAGVNYVSQRAELLMAFFYLLTLYAAFRGFERHSVSWHALAVLACALGMGTKQVMITAPVMVVCLESITGFGGSFLDALRRRWRFYACLAATWIVLVGLALLRREEQGESLVWSRISPLLYAATQSSVIVRYLRLSLWPRPLCFDYRWPPAGSVMESPFATALVAAGVVLTLRLLRRRSPGALPGVWFFGILSPTSSFVARPDVAFEHRMYLPLAAVVAVVVVGGYSLLRRRARPVILCVCALSLVCAMGLMTHDRNPDYRSEVAMWSDVVRKAPHNLRAWNDLAVALSEEGRVEEALETYGRVLAAIPSQALRALEDGTMRVTDRVPTDSFEFHYFRAHANMGLLQLNMLGDPGAAVRHYAAALRVIPYREDVRKKLKRALKITGTQEKDLDVAMERVIRGQTP